MNISRARLFWLPSDRVWSFDNVFGSITPGGELFSSENHGRFFMVPATVMHCAQFRGLVGKLKARYQNDLVTNVDNAVATIDPVIYGHHLSNKQLLELVDRDGGDTGGARFGIKTDSSCSNILDCRSTQISIRLSLTPTRFGSI